MAFFALLWKARTIENYRNEYEKEKIKSILLGGKQVEQTLSQRWRHYRVDTKKRISRCFKKWCPDGSAVSNFCFYLVTDQTFPNFLLKSVMGFVGGIILTYLCFMFFVFQLAISLTHATIMSSIIGVLLTLGLAFSYRIRCLVFLLIPQFFSRVGRYTLTCYALVLILTGPATNTLKNSEVLSESMACSQEQIKTSVQQLNEIIKKPLNAMKDSLKLMVDQLKIITAKVKETVIRIDRLVLTVANGIQSSFSWLQSVLDMCNAKLGTPYERCCNVIEDGITRCQKTINPKFSIACNVASVAHIACYTVKPFKAFCYATDFMDEAILASVKKKVRNFSEHLRAMFHVDIHIHHSYTYSSNTSRSASQVAAGIVTEIRNRADPLLTWLSWSSCVTSLFLLLIIFRAKYYQHMYETRSRFDNRYVTKELQELDLKRQQQGKETVLPLNRRERAKYITTSSFRLVASEKVYLNRSAVFMAITTFKLLIHMVADYSLYWVLMTIRYHGRFQSDLMPGIPHSGAHVHGTGFVANLFKSIIDILDIPLSFPAPSSSSCLPDPYPPDLRRYTQIGVLIFLLWFFALFEPYGLRLRHLIMGHYRPERAKARAIWLFNHILRTRGSFMKFARRKLHREYKYSSESALTFRQWITDLIPFQCLRSLVGLGPRQQHCLLCGITASFNDPDFQLTKCHTPGCPGVFCTSCFADIGELCTICLSPADYGDFSDISLEKGSSDDSDSDGEFNEGRINENIPSLQNVESDRIEKAISNSERRWDFFTKAIGHSEPFDAIGLLHTYKNEGTIFTTLFKKPLRSMRSNMEKRCRIKKYTLEWVAKLTPENMFIDFSIDENQNHLNSTDINDYGKFNEVIHRTKSIGVNTDRNRGVLLNMLVNSFNRRKSMQLHNRKRKDRLDRKQKIPQFFPEVTSKKVISLKPTDKTKKQTNIDKNNRTLFLTKIFHAHNLTLRQRNLKKIVRSHKGSRTKVKIKRYEELKGMIKTIRYCLKSKEINVSNQNNGDTPNNAGVENRREINNAKLNRKKNKKQFSKSKSRRQKGSIKIKKKNSRHKMTRFNKFFSNHWNNFKCSVIPCTVKNRPDIPIPKVKRNHKRRKKRNLSIDLNKADIDEFTRKEVKQTRNFRISAFLAELEWNKRDYRKKNEFVEGIDSFVLTDFAPPPNLTNKIVGMVQLKNMPFQWREATKYKSCNCEDGKFDGAKKQQSAGKQFASVSKHRVSPKEALERFRNRVSTAVTPSSSLVHRMLSTISISEAARPFERESSICISKRASVYRSFTEELTQNVGCDSESHHTNNFKTDVLFKNVKYDALLKNSSKGIEPINLAVPPLQFPENEVIVSRSTRNPSKPIVTRGCRCEWLDDIQKKWAGVTKKSKISKMKDFCSSLFGPSCSKKTCPHINKREEDATSNIPEERSPEHKKVSSATQTQYVRDTHTQVSSEETPTDEDKIIEPSPTIIETRSPTIIEPRPTVISARSPTVIEPRSPTIEARSPTIIEPRHSVVEPRSPTIIEPRSPTIIQPRSPTRRSLIEPRQSMIEPSRSHKTTKLGISSKKSKSQYKDSSDAVDKDIIVEKYNKSRVQRYCPRERAMLENFRKKCAVYRDNSPNSLEKDEDSVPKVDKANNTIKPPKQETDGTQTFNLNSAETQVPEQIEERGGHTLLDKSCASIRRQLESCLRKHSEPMKYSETRNCVICKCAQTQTSSPAVVKKITACAASLKKIQNGDEYQRMPLTMRASIEKYLNPFSGSQTDKTGYSLNRATQYDGKRPRCCQELRRVNTSANRGAVLTKNSCDETLRMTPPETCTCATQYYAGTHQPNSPRLLKSIMVDETGTPINQCVNQKTQCKRKQDMTDKSVSCLRSGGKKDANTSMSKMNEKPSIESDNELKAIDYETTPRASQEDLSDTLTGRSSSSESFRSVDSKSDTTIYSLAYDDIPRRRKYRIKVVTKSNRATSTDKTKVCDTGTITDDWWSPIIERKGHEMIFLEKKKGSNALEKQRKEWRQVKEAKKRIVSFKSRTQIIPTSFKTKDVMSPSRYLLESQKYYNELFAGSYCPRAQAAYVTQMPKYYEKDKSRSPVGSRRNHLHRKTKRLDECYSPIKQLSPRKRKSDSTKTSDSPHRKLDHRHDRLSTNRHYAKVGSPKKRIT